MTFEMLELKERRRGGKERNRLFYCRVYKALVCQKLCKSLSGNDWVHFPNCLALERLVIEFP